MPPKKEARRSVSATTSRSDHRNDAGPTPIPTKLSDSFPILNEESAEKITSPEVLPDSNPWFRDDYSFWFRDHDTAGMEYYRFGTVAWLCRAVMNSLTFLLQSSVITVGSKKNKNILQRCHATLKLWMHGHHTWTGGLDQALKRSTRLEHTTLSVLQPLCVALQHGLETHCETAPDDLPAVQLLKATKDACSSAKVELRSFEQPKGDSDSSDDDELDDDSSPIGMEGIAEKIKIYTHCLLDLSAALESPAPDTEHIDLVVTQPQHSSLASAEKADAIPRLSDYPGEPWVGSSLFIDAQIPPLFHHCHTMPPDFYSVPDVGSYNCNEPLWSSSSMSDMRPVRVTTDATQLVRKTVRDENGRRFYECPFRKAEARLGLLYSCEGALVDTVFAVRVHLTQNLPPGRPPHLPFLKICPTCNEDILDDEFVTRHDGLKCNNPLPHRRGAIGQQEQYDRLCSKVEAYIAAQEAQKARHESGLDIAPGPSMRQKRRRSFNQKTSHYGKADDSDFSDFRLTSEQGPLPTPNHGWEIHDFQVPGGFFEALDDEELGNQRQDSTLIPDIGSSRHLSKPGTTIRQPEDGPTSSSAVPKSLPCDVEGCDARFFVGMDEELARKHHNHRFHQNLHSDQSQIRRSQSPKVIGGEQDEHLSEAQDRP